MQRAGRPEATIRELSLFCSEVGNKRVGRRELARRRHCGAERSDNNSQSNEHNSVTPSRNARLEPCTVAYQGLRGMAKHHLNRHECRGGEMWSPHPSPGVQLNGGNHQVRTTVPPLARGEALSVGHRRALRKSAAECAAATGGFASHGVANGFPPNETTPCGAGGCGRVHRGAKPASGSGWESNPPGDFSDATLGLKPRAVTRSAYTPGKTATRTG